MAEPIIPLVGLSLGVTGLLPPTMKLINAWTTFIKDIRNSGDDAKKLSLQFEQLSLRYRSLVRVLFNTDKFSFIEGVLFDKLPSREQDTISGMLKELPQLLYEHYLIANAYQLDPNSPKSRSPETIQTILDPKEMELLFESGSIPEKRKSATVGRSKGFWWAVRTKGRIERLVSEYGSWLENIKSCLEACWWPLSFFDKYVNVQALEKDEDCASIGLAGQASARKLLLDDAQPEGELDLGRPPINLKALNGALRGILAFEGAKVLVEMMPFEPDKDGFLPELLKKRFCKVASVMHRQIDPEFQTLPCKGFFECHADTSLSLPDSFVLVSELPQNSTGKFRTLSQIYADERGDRKPELGQRVELGHRLAQSLSLFHSIGWLHRSFRSENILFFQSSQDDESRRELIEPFICGFEAARLTGEWSVGRHPQDSLENNIYRHPNRWGLPSDYFNMYHDLYGKNLFMRSATSTDFFYFSLRRSSPGDRPLGEGVQHR